MGSELGLQRPPMLFVVALESNVIGGITTTMKSLLRLAAKCRGVLGMLRLRHRCGEALLVLGLSEAHSDFAVQHRVVEQAIHLWLGQYGGFGADRQDKVAGWLPTSAAAFRNISKNGG